MVVLGVDEVGRGCWAGPVVAAAVVLAEPIPGLRDSKKLTKAAREKLVVQIQFEALAIGVGWVDAATIDAIGIASAVKQAMELAVGQIDVAFDQLIVDGNINFFADDPRSQAIIRADDSVPAVSAASIIAKVARDNFMAKQAQTFPGYGFESHVGYGTAQHIEQLKLRGVTKLHRKSYKPIKLLLTGVA